jgi:hypothetical protein
MRMFKNSVIREMFRPQREEYQKTGGDFLMMTSICPACGIFFG